MPLELIYIDLVYIIGFYSDFDKWLEQIINMQCHSHGRNILMIDVNVNERKQMYFTFNNLSTVKHAKLVVITPNHILFTFPANIDYQQNKVFVDLPILSNIFKSEVISTCYLEMVDNQNKLLKSSKQQIRFHSQIPSKENQQTGVDVSLPFPSIVLKKIKRDTSRIERVH